MDQYFFPARFNLLLEVGDSKEVYHKNQPDFIERNPCQSPHK
jgi:hypothetical protein